MIPGVNALMQKLDKETDAVRSLHRQLGEAKEGERQLHASMASSIEAAVSEVALMTVLMTVLHAASIGFHPF